MRLHSLDNKNSGPVLVQTRGFGKKCDYPVSVGSDE